jgi:hypothetical protein
MQTENASNVQLCKGDDGIFYFDMKEVGDLCKSINDNPMESKPFAVLGNPTMKSMLIVGDHN